MVEAVHAAGTHSLILHVAVPALPDGGGSVIDGVEPRGILALIEECVGYVAHSILGESGHEDGCTQESCLQAVAMVLEVLAQASYHILLGLAFHKSVLQSEESRSLHGVEDVGLERSVGVEEGLTQMLLGSLLHIGILGSIASCGLCHVAHHSCINGPVRGAQIVPVHISLGAVYMVTLFVHHANGTAAGLQRFVAQPVGPLEVAILPCHSSMVILDGIHIVHHLLHSFPVLGHNLIVAKLFPHHPRYYYSGIGPAQATHAGGLGSILCKGCHTREGTSVMLGISHVTHPLMEEVACIGKEGTRLGEHLSVGSPSQTLVALWAVSRHRQIVGPLSPKCIGYQLIDKWIASGDMSYLHVLGNGCDGDGAYALNLYLIGGCDGYQSVTEEGVRGTIGLGLLCSCKGIGEVHAQVGNAKVETVRTSLRTIHTAALGSVAVVEQLRYGTGEHGTLFGLEDEVGYSSTVLTEVHHEGLAWTHGHGLALSKLLLDDYRTICLLALACYTLPCVCLDGQEGQIFTLVYLGTIRGENLAIELIVQFGCGKLLGCIISREHTGIVLFSVEDGSMCNGTCHT